MSLFLASLPGPFSKTAALKCLYRQQKGRWSSITVNNALKRTDIVNTFMGIKSSIGTLNALLLPLQ